MLCKVTRCAGRVSANTRPHQLRWGDREMGTAISCTECSQVIRARARAYRGTGGTGSIVNKAQGKQCKANSACLKAVCA